MSYFNDILFLVQSHTLPPPAYHDTCLYFNDIHRYCFCVSPVLYECVDQPTDVCVFAEMCVPDMAGIYNSLDGHLSLSFNSEDNGVCCSFFFKYNMMKFVHKHKLRHMVANGDVRCPSEAKQFNA